MAPPGDTDWKHDKHPRGWAGIHRSRLPAATSHNSAGKQVDTGKQEGTV